jgi:hypothetical protein
MRTYTYTSSTPSPPFDCNDSMDLYMRNHATLTQQTRCGAPVQGTRPQAAPARQNARSQSSCKDQRRRIITYLALMAHCIAEMGAHQRWPPRVVSGAASRRKQTGQSRVIANITHNTYTAPHVRHGEVAQDLAVGVQNRQAGQAPEQETGQTVRLKAVPPERAHTLACTHNPKPKPITTNHLVQVYMLKPLGWFTHRHTQKHETSTSATSAHLVLMYMLKPLGWFTHRHTQKHETSTSATSAHLVLMSAMASMAGVSGCTPSTL